MPPVWRGVRQAGEGSESAANGAGLGSEGSEGREVGGASCEAGTLQHERKGEDQARGLRRSRTPQTEAQDAPNIKCLAPITKNPLPFPYSHDNDSHDTDTHVDRIPPELVEMNPIVIPVTRR